MNPRIQMIVDALRQRSLSPDPSMTASGQQLPPQAVLDQPIPGAAQGPSIEGASGQFGTGGSVIDALRQRELQRQQMLQGL